MLINLKFLLNGDALQTQNQISRITSFDNCYNEKRNLDFKNLGGVSNRRSSDVFPQATSATRLQRTGRVRTRGGQRGNSANTSARKPLTPKPSEKMTVK